MPDARNPDRSDWDFADLLDWHLRRGTRRNGRPETPGKVWTTKEFSAVVFQSDRTIRNWRLGRTLPAQINHVEYALFGENPAYQAWRNEFREAYSQGNRSFEDEVQELRERRETGSYAKLGIEDFQTYISETPLVAGTALVCLSIFLGPQHNQLRSLDDLLGFGGPLNLVIEPVASFDGLLDHLVAELPRSLREQVKWNIRSAIDTQNAILYSGSVNSANSAQLGKLPNVLKAFASLSKRQFRLGLFRLSATVIVLSVSGGAAAYTGWAAAKKLHAVMSTVIPALSAREK